LPRFQKQGEQNVKPFKKERGEYIRLAGSSQPHQRDSIIVLKNNGVGKCDGCKGGEEHPLSGKSRVAACIANEKTHQGNPRRSDKKELSHPEQVKNHRGEETLN